MAFSFLKPSHLLLACALVVVASPQDAAAWGFGRAQSSAVLGVPLDFGVGLRLDAGEAPPECISADVTVGDIPLPRSAVSVVVDLASTNPSLRVRTSVAIDEPLVSVNLSAGCTSRLTRRFTLLADPPGHLAAPILASAEAQPAAAASTPPAAAQSPAATAPLQAAPATPPSTAVAPPAAPAPPAGVASEGAARTAAASPSAKGSGDVAPARPAAPARERADPAKLADARASAGDRQQKAAPAERPRLQLDAPVVSASKGAAAGAPSATGRPKPAAVMAAEEAASAARAAASAAEARAAAMEKNIEALRQEAKANREALARLTQALKEAQSVSPEIPVSLWGALAGLAALSAVLMLRLRRTTAGSSKAPWWSPSNAQGESEAKAGEELQPGLPGLPELAEAPPVEPAAKPPRSQPATAEREFPAASAEAGLGAAPKALRAEASSPALPPLPMPEVEDDDVGAMERTQLLPPSASSVSAPIQGVPIEELLDLEQQVEFFTVLGQDDAALNLLVEHLRSTGGTYPLPYLKLLEIYRRKGDEESYERTRDRFNQRFNAVAPAWGAPPMNDRHLEELPHVLQKIEQAWPRPVDAMALLENMLVRTEGGTLLDLAALGEVLFLFTLARDLHEQEPGDSAPVDVLLPLGDFDFDPEPAPIPALAPSSDQAEPAGVRDYAATQFGASSFGIFNEASAPAPAPTVSESAAPEAPDDHIDLPFGEPMFEPDFSLPEPEVASASTARDLADLSSGQRGGGQGPSIDLPVFDDPVAGVGRGPEPPAAAQVPAYDFALPMDAPSSAPAVAAADDPFLEPLSFDLPDMDEGAPSKAAPRQDNVDLDISLDGLELEPMAPKLSPQEEEAASNFGLFNPAPTPGKSRG